MHSRFRLYSQKLFQLIIFPESLTIASINQLRLQYYLHAVVIDLEMICWNVFIVTLIEHEDMASKKFPSKKVSI